MTADGTAETALSAQAIEDAVEKALATGAEACAVCLLFAYLNDDHERRIGNALAARAPDLAVSTSSDVQPEFREYERFSTTVLNAYLQPVMGRYLAELDSRIGEAVPGVAVGIYQSSGGLMSVERARRYPVRTALSGPAAGAVGAGHIGRLAGRGDFITLDMGGTSADVALVRDHDAGTSFERDVAGFPVRLPMVDINTVGAGGGSIAWFDRDGLMKVGPNSAGADPGPACYGRGGEAPTVTDANLVLGRLSEGGLIGGRMGLDRDAARAALAPIADRLGYTVERTALGIVGIVAANMVRAIRAVSVERGHDPRDYALMPFGGAGPLHAAEVAKSLAMTEIIVPAAPGILCAEGLIVSDLKEGFARTVHLPLAEDSRGALADAVNGLAERAAAWFENEGVTRDDRTLSVVLDLRYIGQNYELPVALDGVPGGQAPAIPAIDAVRDMFFAAHQQFYGFHNPDDPVELVTVRATARGATGESEPPPAETAGAAPPEPATRRPVWFAVEAADDTPVYDRAALVPGQTFDGPAIVEQFDSTTILHPGDRLRVDGAGNLIITVTP
jgi:N-methylhydantoinase A